MTGLTPLLRWDPRLCWPGCSRKSLSPDDAISVFTVQDPKGLESVLEKIS